MQLKFSETLDAAIKREAKALEISPSQLVRMIVSERFRVYTTGGAENTYLMRVPNWQELEAYVKVKHGCYVGDFAAKVAVGEMRRCPLTKAQKDEFDRLLGK